MKRFHHVLIVGGSGMLAGLCRALLGRCDTLSVMARNENRIRAIAPSVHPLVCDYNDSGAADAALAADKEAHGAPDLVVAWVHGRAPQLRRRLAEAVAQGGRFVQVLGSTHGDPARPDRLDDMQRCAENLPIVYQAVVLGFAVEGAGSRWLTNEEISAGVLRALETGASPAAVGTLQPWSARP